jgi:hypothetical protein
MKKLIKGLVSGDLVSIPSDLGYYGPSGKFLVTYQFIEFKDEGTRCILKDLITEEESLWSVSWIKKVYKKVV